VPGSITSHELTRVHRVSAFTNSDRFSRADKLFYDQNLVRSHAWWRVACRAGMRDTGVALESVMHILKVGLRGSAWWWVRPTDKPIYSFDHRPGWVFINPAFYKKITEGQSPDTVTCFGGPESRPGTFVVCSNVICLQTPFTSWESRDALGLFDVISHLLRQLRYSSRYAVFPTNHTVLSISVRDPKDFQELPVPEETKSGAVSNVPEQALITERRIEAFTRLAVDFCPPVHAEVLLDAIEAHVASDFKKCILFAAIAAETMVTTVLENAYAAILGSTVTSPQHRVVEITEPGGERRRLDPIFKMLADNRSSYQIRRLVHEASLYTLGKSLMIDEKKLYDEILEMFKTRHQIAHTGGTDIDNAGWGGNFRGTASALRSVERLFEWYGEPGPYPVLDDGMTLRGTSD